VELAKGEDNERALAAGVMLVRSLQELEAIRKLIAAALT
jgi:hypothetical protein